MNKSLHEKDLAIYTYMNTFEYIDRLVCIDKYIHKYIYAYIVYMNSSILL